MILVIYLDYSATTPVDSRVLDTFVQVTKQYIGNPNSLHKLGVEAKGLIDASTKQIASILGVKSTEIIYTSGASEANNMVIKGVAFTYANRGRHIITTELEHSSVIAPIGYLQKLGYEVDFVKLDANGLVDLEDLEQLMRDDTILVSICAVNSEVGIILPLVKIDKKKKRYPKAYFHSDITQSLGKQKIDLSCLDFASFSAQKFFGMKGIGGLIKKEHIVIEPLIHGGKSTTVFRSGTPSPALIASLAKALRLVYDDFDAKLRRVLSLNQILLEGLAQLPVTIHSNSYCVPHIINVGLKNIRPETMLHALEQEDIFISTQTACSTGNYSKAVYAIIQDEEASSHSIRISISSLTTEEEIQKFLNVFAQKLNQLDFHLDKNMEDV